LDDQMIEKYHELFKKNIARVQIYFKNIQKTVISEEARIALVDMIANLGGTLSLFLGNLYIYYSKIAYLHES